MIFNSLQFALFFAVVLAIYWTLSHRKQNWLLLIASYLFYGYWDWRLLGLLVGVTAAAFITTRQIDASTSERDRKRWLLVSVAINLVVLGFFKYFGFFVDSTHDLGASLGLELPEQILKVLLPIGISFYTFHAISYAIDVYRRRIEAERSPVTFALFIAYFPQLLAGPIERARHLLPQIRNERRRPERGADRLRARAHRRRPGEEGGDRRRGRADRERDLQPAERPRRHPARRSARSRSRSRSTATSPATPTSRGARRGCSASSCSGTSSSPTSRRTSRSSGGRWHISLSTWLHDYLYVPARREPRRQARRRTATSSSRCCSAGCGTARRGRSCIWGALHGTALAVERAFGVVAPPGPARTTALAGPARDALDVRGS